MVGEPTRSSQASSQASPLLLQFLDALLAQRGLPYQEALKATIRSHLSALLREFPSLQVKVEAFTQSSDGSPPTLLLQVGGTIPVLFLQVLYNIPLVLWLSHQYPSCPPLVFLSPSPFMLIKTPHPLVHPSGFVSSPHLHSWAFPASNLVDLVRSLCVAFGHDPPLYSVMHPPHAQGVEFSLAHPLPTSTSGLSTSTSLLGPGSLLQQYPLHANSARIFTSDSPSPQPSTASTSASLLGHGSLSQRWPSHGHVAGLQITNASQPSSGTSSSLQQYSSHPHGSGVYHLPAASSSSTSTVSLGPLPSAQQHPPNAHGAGVSMAHSSSSLPTSGSLLGPGKVSQLYTFDGAGRHMCLPNPGPQLLSGLSNRPSSLTQGFSSLAYDVKMAVTHHPPPPLSLSTLTSTSASASASTSLLGPGNVLQLHPLHEARISSAYLSMPATSALIGPGPLRQCHPPHMHDVRVSMARLPTASATTSASASLLGGGSLSQRHRPHGHVGISMAYQPQPTSLSLLVPEALLYEHPGANHAHEAGELHQHPGANHAHRAGELLDMVSSCPSHVHGTGALAPSSTMSSDLAMANDTGPPSSVQHHFYPPNQHSPFSNPPFGMTDLPPESRQNVMDTLIGRLQCDLEEISKAKEMDMLKLMDIEGLLKQRQGFCDKVIQEMQQQKENLELQLQTFLINIEFLETWLVANNQSNMEIDIDDVFEPCDGLSNQLLECTALDLAIEDSLYCLDKAAQEGIVPVDSYLRHVRTLSREQFFHRAIALKVNAAQGILLPAKQASS